MALVTSADLTGKAMGYRGVAIRCPGCAAPMRQLNLEEAAAEVDVCDACGGLWVDWFDGEVRAIATETLRVSSAGPPPPEPAGAAEAKSAAHSKPSAKEKSGKGGKAGKGGKPEKLESAGKAEDGSRPSLNEPLAIGACPRCTHQLVAERYSVIAEIASRRVEGKTSVVPGTTGAELLRCEDCMGAFVSRTSAEVLSWLSATDDPPASVTPAKLEPVPWDRFVGLIQSFLGLKK
jgi:Zn-finger nucleic acid-binding protein